MTAVLSHLFSLRRILSPPACETCGEDMNSYEGFCPICRETLIDLSGPCCVICALPLEGAGVGSHRCGECLVLPPSFDRVTAVWEYGGAVAKAVHLAKFGKNPRPLIALARMARGVFQEAISRFQPDFVMPVPLPLFRRLTRGYNQSALIWETWRREGKLKIKEWSGVRRGWSAPQATQGRRERLRALRGTVRRSRGHWLRGKRVMMIDDVLTTGSTAEVLGRTLKGAGATGVEMMVLARVPKKVS